MKSAKPIESLILTVRGQRVILDAELARLYGVETRALNQAMKRNTDRFPTEFAFPLTRVEILRISQTVTSLRRLKFSKSVHVFTEHGALQAANVLNSPQAVQMSLYVIRAFVKMRGVLSDTRELAGKLARLERDLKGRLNVHEAAIVDVLQRVMEILDPPPAPEPPQRRIGFKTDES